ncbi:MAG: hypothetical protein GVY10_02115 [Verrucomicrobia bacterium]|jgi:hypothetical protein|nr:hypothetical protein [Verrucomicrobiota bacterium]
MSSDLLHGNRKAFVLLFVTVLLLCLLYGGFLLSRALSGEWSNATTLGAIPFVILFGGVFLPLRQQLLAMNREIRRREEEKAAGAARKG